MQHDDLPLFAYVPPVKIIPFPALKRVGQAKKIAEQLAKARTQREADHILSRSVQAYSRQMSSARVAEPDIARETLDFLTLIHAQCLKLRARWRPSLPRQSDGTDNPRGAA
ncbi:hypothetical protein DEM27_28570 [Metarhizobium album]|uniref:Uncharacterized protein n=1 Tax=Metarhizobium album TaxID=2182425 RepID=A0A2U2DHI7_9HYPH|nr:DUF6074 family protein [Rhizobium album]PWE52762.1 hypothetical protein DEM27_28570 [Rhizobium album]